jgi:hypothetical protein
VRLCCTLALAASLTACGGGGGNPGTCSGSALVCGSGQPVASSAAPETYTPVPAASLGSITCPEILALNGGDKTAALAAAQDAYRRGRTDLDGDNDGLACNGGF